MGHHPEDGTTPVCSTATRATTSAERRHQQAGCGTPPRDTARLCRLTNCATMPGCSRPRRTSSPIATAHSTPPEWALSRWGNDSLNGPAVVGLAARCLENEYGVDGFLPTRLTADLFKAAHRVPTEVRTRLVRDGRRIRGSECDVMQDGVVVARATMVQYRRPLRRPVRNGWRSSPSRRRRGSAARSTPSGSTTSAGTPRVRRTRTPPQAGLSPHHRGGGRRDGDLIRANRRRRGDQHGDQPRQQRHRLHQR